jgi:long-chain acyl-CoA synthetase
MLDLAKYDSLGAALRDALAQWPEEVCLIEADREREKSRLTYRQFGQAAEPLAAALEESGFAAGERAAIIMTNQPKWPISAYAVFFAGGILVPLDYKLTAAEHLQLLAHSQAQVLFVEYPLWRAITQAPAFREHKLRKVLVTEAPSGTDLAGAERWEDFRGLRAPEFRPRAQTDTACIVYSSGTGGHPRGCVLTHDNYLEQCAAVSPVFPFWPGARYLSIIPTNHAIDFMGGFIMPFTGGGTVVHLRTLRPEFIREAFTKYKVTYMAVVPLILKNLQRGLRERFAALPSFKRKILDTLIAVNRAFTHAQPRPGLSRVLLKDIHQAFGGGLQALLVGGAFTEPATIEFFHDLGIPIYNGYGCTEACTAITLNDLRPFRPDTVGKPVRGMEIRIVDPDADGIGEVAVRSKTVMSGYLDDPEMTAETLVNGWLMTGDLGRVDATGHLRLFGRKKNMIVTAEGKNIYPEDIENNFEGIGVKEFCVYAANYIWPQHSMTGEQLVLVLRPEPGRTVDDALLRELTRRNAQLLNHKRVWGYLQWEQDFPRNAAMKIRRVVLAGQIGKLLDRGAMVPL